MIGRRGRKEGGNRIREKKGQGCVWRPAPQKLGPDVQITETSLNTEEDAG